jgi:multidrug efflux pump subunit AcrA (membrane-fusion protein)
MCASATKQVLVAETVVLHAQQALSSQLTALGDALATAVAAAGTSSHSSGGSGTTSGGGSGGSGTTSGGGSGGGRSGPVTTGGATGTVTAAQLAADQATADADAAQVTVAQQDLANATVLSPISGTVVSLDVSPGTAASAGSAAFEIAGLDSYQVVTDVPVSDLPALKVGQRASVQPDGLNRPLTGAVVSIGLTPDASASPVTYPVTIGLTGQAAAPLHANSFADVTITTGRSRGVSVPTSAVHYSGHSATVTVYSAGQTHSVKVRVGIKGLVMTRITAGLKAGQHVVLADLRKPLPSTNVPGLGGPGIGAVNVVGPP